MENYSIKTISHFECKDWLLNKHYAKRIPPIEYSFGLFLMDECVGICTFGTPVSSTLRQLIEGYKLLELNRLVVNDGLKDNSLSWFLSRCLKLLPSPLVIVSYADTSMNHNGYIYQATNWIYTGLSAKFKDYMVRGMEHLHNGTIMDMSRGKENRVQWLRDKFGDDLYMLERPRKHRYFYFLGTKKEKRDMRNKLPYDVIKYPKGENQRYDSSYIVNTQTRLF